MSGHADTLSALDLVLSDVRSAGDRGRDIRLEPHQARIITREHDALLAENQRNNHKVAAYDAARATVKIEGNTRAYYVLRAEAAEAENQRLREKLELIDAAVKQMVREALAGDTAPPLPPPSEKHVHLKGPSGTPSLEDVAGDTE